MTAALHAVPGLLCSHHVYSMVAPESCWPSKTCDLLLLQPLLYVAASLAVVPMHVMTLRCPHSHLRISNQATAHLNRL